MRKPVIFADNLRRKVRGYIYRPWRTDPRTGKRLLAITYGLRAWKIPIFDTDRN